MDANWQIASYRAEAHKSCNCIMLWVRFPACWKFFMYGENKQIWIITERHQQTVIFQVYLIANEKEKTFIKKKKKQNHKKIPQKPSQTNRCMWVNPPKQTAAYGLAMGLWVFLLVAGIYLSLRLLPYSWRCEKLAFCILSYTSHFILSLFSLT